MPAYKVTVEGSDPLPIDAPNPTSARNRAVRERVKVERLSTADAMAFGRKGIELIVVGEEEAEPEAEPNSAGEGKGAGEGEAEGDGKPKGEAPAK